MAYLVQLGAANYKGSIVATGDIEMASDDVVGSTVTVAGDLTTTTGDGNNGQLLSTHSSARARRVNAVTSITYRAGASLGSGDKLAKFEHVSNSGKVSLYSLSGDQEDAMIDFNSNNVRMRFKDGAVALGDAPLVLDSNGGAITAELLDINGNLQAASATLSDVQLIVEDSAGVSVIGTTNFETHDLFVELGKGDDGDLGDLDAAGFMFGLDNSGLNGGGANANDAGAGLLWRTANSGFFQVRNMNNVDNTLYSAEAATWYGSAAGLSFKFLGYGNAEDTTGAGSVSINANKNGKVHYSSANGTVAYTLPNTSGVSAGQVFRFKVGSGGSSVATVLSADAAQTIDGVDCSSSALSFPANAAFDIVCDGTKWFIC